MNDATNTSGNINITIENTALQVPDPIHPHFSQFSASRRSSSLVHVLTGSDFTDADLTDGNWTNFQLEGHSRAVANLSIGTLTLDPINFNVASGLNGLQGLQNLVTIGGVDVIGGTSDGLTLGINGECTCHICVLQSLSDFMISFYRESFGLAARRR